MLHVTNAEASHVDPDSIDSCELDAKPDEENELAVFLNVLRIRHLDALITRADL
jgi:hypothetical protein